MLDIYEGDEHDDFEREVEEERRRNEHRLNMGGRSARETEISMDKDGTLPSHLVEEPLAHEVDEEDDDINREDIVRDDDDTRSV